MMVDSSDNMVSTNTILLPVCKNHVPPKIPDIMPSFMLIQSTIVVISFISSLVVTPGY